MNSFLDGMESALRADDRLTVVANARVLRYVRLGIHLV